MAMTMLGYHRWDVIAKSAASNMVQKILHFKLYVAAKTDNISDHVSVFNKHIKIITKMLLFPLFELTGCTILATTFSYLTYHNTVLEEAIYTVAK